MKTRPTTKVVGLPLHLTEFFVINQLVDRGIFTTHRAAAILTELQPFEIHRQRVEKQKAPD